jgi:hypothetical protein
MEGEAFAARHTGVTLVQYVLVKFILFLFNPSPHAGRKGFDSIVLLLVWTLLKERNSLLKKLSEACTCDVAKLVCDACNCLVSVAKEKESETSL